MVSVTSLALLLKYWRIPRWVLKNIQINGKTHMEQTEFFPELMIFVLCDRFS